MNSILTIAIPTKDRHHLLEDSLVSLINQDCFNQVEIVICDNSLCNDTEEMISRFKSYKNISYIRNQHLLPIDKNMIKVGMLSKSKYFLWLGDDDILLDSALPIILQAINTQNFDFCLLKAKNLSSDMTEELSVTLKDIREDETYNNPVDFFKTHVFNMPFGTLLVNTNLFISVCQVQRFNGTSHAYSGLVFEYLANKWRNKGSVNVLVLSIPLVGLRCVEKSWISTATRIFLKEVPEWFYLLDEIYQTNARKIAKSYLMSKFSKHELIQMRHKYNMSAFNYKDDLFFASNSQKLKYLIICSIPKILLSKVW